jgi:hypothetical protein
MRVLDLRQTYRRQTKICRLQRGDFGEPLHGVLTRDIDRRAWQRFVAGNRRQVDDAALLLAVHHAQLMSEPGGVANFFLLTGYVLPAAQAKWLRPLEPQTIGFQRLRLWRGVSGEQRSIGANLGWSQLVCLYRPPSGRLGEAVAEASQYVAAV